jgi:hypothetical protein
MSATARDYQSPNPPSTEGLDHLFEVDELKQSSDSHCENHCESLESQMILTAAEASVHLGIPISTIYRRIKAGRFTTVEGQDGSVRIILPPKNKSENHPITTFASGENQNVEVILTDSHLESTENQVRINPGSDNIDRLLNVINEKDQKLEAATYRIGWLESQLQDREKEIKLLTDSQHKPGWWAKFSNWFFKAQ